MIIAMSVKRNSKTNSPATTFQSDFRAKEIIEFFLKHESPGLN